MIRNDRKKTTKRTMKIFSGKYFNQCCRRFPSNENNLSVVFLHNREVVLVLNRAHFNISNADGAGTDMRAYCAAQIAIEVIVVGQVCVQCLH